MSPSRQEQIAFSKSQCQPLCSERRAHVFLRDPESSSQSPVIGVTAHMLPARSITRLRDSSRASRTNACARGATRTSFIGSAGPTSPPIVRRQQLTANGSDTWRDGSARIRCVTTGSYLMIPVAMSHPTRASDAGVKEDLTPSWQTFKSPATPHYMSS
jgi:hypothetical protein